MIEIIALAFLTGFGLGFFLMKKVGEDASVRHMKKCHPNETEGV